MPAILHCVRHAQGFHNVPGYDMSKRDPALTPHGKSQCTTLASNFPFHSSINQVFASPLQRTLATAYLSFRPALQSKDCIPQILALPDAQETSEYPCDIGSELAELTQLCDEEGWNVDLSLIHEGWNDKSWDGRWSPTARRIKARARDARRTIREKIAELQKNGESSPEVVLVSHGGYLHYFTEDWEDSNVFSGTGWANTEYRSYIFEAGIDGNDSNASIRETAESRQRRGKTSQQPSRKEQNHMFETSMQQWEAQGMQDPEKVGWRDDRNDNANFGEEPAAGVVPAERRKSTEVRL